MEISSDIKQKIADVQRQFDEDAKQVSVVSSSMLLKILDYNKDTEYGKQHGFGSITNIKQFKESHPLTTYKDYKPFIERMLNGETNVLSAYPVEFFGRSSGTTGFAHQKIMPHTTYRSP